MKVTTDTNLKIQNPPSKSVIGALQATFLKRIIGGQTSNLWNVMKLFNWLPAIITNPYVCTFEQWLNVKSIH